ncbi:hypothetical protein Hanom_Chr08g00753071 [Helianthus anomalus]
MLRSWKNDPVDSVSKSEDETEEIVGDGKGICDIIIFLVVTHTHCCQCSIVCIYIQNFGTI